jgi:putative inorganic carbon (HCO3(-)) transporter
MSVLMRQLPPMAIVSRRTVTTVATLALVAVTSSVLLWGPIVSLGAVVAVVVMAALLTNAELAVLIFVAVAPFEGYAKAVSGSAVKALGAALFAAWLLSVLRRGRVRLAQPVIGCAIALLAVLLASTVLHANGPLGTEVATRYVSYIAALVVLVDCMANRLPPRLVAQVYVAASTLAALAGLVAFFRHNLRAGGPVGDPNDFAFFLLAALALTLGLRRDEPRRRYAVAAIILLLGIVATLSRGALVGLAAMFVLAAAAHLIRMRAVFGTAAVVGVAVVCVLLLDPTKVSTSLHAKGFVAAQNVDERLLRWQVAAEMTYDHPIVGLGPGGYRENFDRYINYQPADLSHQLDVAHETYLEVSSELGLLGLGAFLGVIGLGASSAVRSARRGGSDAGLANSVWVATAGAAVAAVFLTEQYYLPLWLLAALGISVLSHEQDGS